MKLYSAKTSQAIDRDAIENHSIAGILLMKRAAWFSLQTLQNHYPKANHVHIVCGTGNNGGDGFMLAQYALINGYEVNLSLLGEATKLTGDALTAYDEMLDCGIKPMPLDSELVEKADVIIDAIFGTGLNSTVTGIYAEAINVINSLNKPVIALDIPSGVHADSGAVLGTAIRANHTCTFISQKLGLHTALGQELSGHIHFSNLFLNKEIYQNHPAIAQHHKLKHWLNKLPKRQANHHKGSAGTSVLIGGNQHMMGAIQLAGLASLKSGCGLSKIISLPEHVTAITQTLPELMCYQQNMADEIINTASAVAIGPGLGKDSWAEQRFNEVMQHPQAKVIDADALRLLKQLLETNKQDNFITANWVLTPHPGEAAELLGVSNQDIQNDRVHAIKQLHNKFGGVIVLKGNGSLIFDGQNLEICTAGNAGMAVGGMGDVLTGTITGLLAQGLSLWDAANLGVSLHAHAADILAKQSGEAGILPSEVAQTLSQLLSYSNAGIVSAAQ